MKFKLWHLRALIVLLWAVYLAMMFVDQYVLPVFDPLVVKFNDVQALSAPSALTLFLILLNTTAEAIAMIYFSSALWFARVSGKWVLGIFILLSLADNFPNTMATSSLVSFVNQIGSIVMGMLAILVLVPDIKNLYSEKRGSWKQILLTSIIFIALLGYMIYMPHEWAKVKAQQPQSAVQIHS